MIYDKLYPGVLHLPYRLDRFKHMERQLNKIGLSSHIHPGTITKSEEWNIYPYKKLYMRTPGAIGCMLGQIGIMEQALREHKHALVMEDDLIFCDDFQARLKILFEYLDDKFWDVLWLGGTFHVNPPYWHTKKHENLPGCLCNLQRDVETTDHPNILRSYGSFSTHAYIVNYNSVEKIVHMLRQSMPETIGIDYSFIKLGPYLHNFVFVPGCVIQMDNKSDIGTGDTIFSGFKKLGPYWYQEKIDQFKPEKFNWHEANNTSK